MSDLFAGGRIIDWILLLIVLEAVALGAWHRRSGRGIPLRQVLGTLASGAALMLALRASLAGQPWTMVALWLSLALLAHLADLASRWR